MCVCECVCECECVCARVCVSGLLALAETVAYEVRLPFISLTFVILICRYNLVYFYFFQVYK